GELFVLIIGCALVLEYAVSNTVVALTWSQYVVLMLDELVIHIPNLLTMPLGYAADANEQFHTVGMNALSISDKVELQAYLSAPRIGDVPVILDLPAGLVTVLVTWLVYVGIKESQRASNIMVAIKVGVILAVIAGGVFFVKPENW